MPLIDVAVDGVVATLTLNDPNRRNAMTLAMCEEITAALDHLEANSEVRALVITGAGSAFCAGADLSHLGQSYTDGRAEDGHSHTDGRAEDGLLAIYEGFLRVGRSPLPTIAAVNGPAVGAGFNLALICDVRLAGRSARFDDRFLQLGIHPGGGHTWMFQNLCGSQVAAAAILFGEIFDGEAAVRVGLAYECVDDDKLLGRATEMARRTAASSKSLVLRTKKSLREVSELTSQDAAVQYELGPQVESTRQPEFQQKLAALRARVSSTPN